MSSPLPSALRARFQRYIEEGLSGRAAALRLKHLLPQGHDGRGKLAPHRAFFEELVTQDSDITLFELRDAVGVQVHHSSVADLLSY